MYAMLRAHGMKPNPEKYVFASRLLGFMISERGIAVNLEKIQAIIEIPLRAIKELQRLTGKYPTSSSLSKSPQIGEAHYLYLATSEEMVAAILVKLENVRQFPVYYVSKVLQNDELRYTKMEKLFYALIIVARKLRLYFQPHPVVIVTDQPMKEVLSKADTSGRVTKWSIELAKFGVDFAL
ncbi:protein SRG1 [Gossypium australe]|uniref:Protein SRG1 n=1 Tax=Gossypium australe TaxID=47621 RepID=A0A5B6X1N4_9ROSI|nr:protein SRG1 [Gossypium australe]